MELYYSRNLLIVSSTWYSRRNSGNPFKHFRVNSWCVGSPVILVEKLSFCMKKYFQIWIPDFRVHRQMNTRYITRVRFIRRIISVTRSTCLMRYRDTLILRLIYHFILGFPGRKSLLKGSQKFLPIVDHRVSVRAEQSQLIQCIWKEITLTTMISFPYIGCSPITQKSLYLL